MAKVTINATDLISDSRTDINANFTELYDNKIETSVLDTDTSLSANSDSKIATQKAVKAYVDSGGQQNASETIRGLVEEATDAEVAAGTATGGTGAKLFITPAKLKAIPVPIIRTYLNAASPATWTKPTGLKYIEVEVLGGGAGGSGLEVSSSLSNITISPGGGAGGYSKKLILSTNLGATETVTIGGGGAGGVGAGAASAGGASSFGAHCSSNGGSINSGSTGGLGGTATGGDLNISGQAGGDGKPGSGRGGSSVYPFLGCGGSGCYHGSSGTYTGESGAAGIVIVKEFY